MHIQRMVWGGASCSIKHHHDAATMVGQHDATPPQDQRMYDTARLLSTRSSDMHPPIVMGTPTISWAVDLPRQT